MSSKSVEPARFRSACARFATGVAVVTVFAKDGSPQGLTVNSFTSVSLDPPIILVAVDRFCALLEHFLDAEFFAVNVLRDSQREISIRFSEWEARRFEGLSWRPGTAPLIDGALAVFECRRTKSFEAGDHTILLAEVEHAGFDHGKPLVYFNSGYAELADAPEVSDRTTDSAAS